MLPPFFATAFCLAFACVRWPLYPCSSCISCLRFLGIASHTYLSRFALNLVGPLEQNALGFIVCRVQQVVLVSSRAAAHVVRQRRAPCPYRAAFTPSTSDIEAHCEERVGRVGSSKPLKAYAGGLECSFTLTSSRLWQSHANSTRTWILKDHRARLYYVLHMDA